MSTAPDFKPRTERVVIFQGDDDERIRELKAKADRLRKSDDDRRPRLMSESGPSAEYAEAAAEHDAFKDEATSRAIVLTIQALRRKQWRSLVAEHEPRPDHAFDKQFGVNIETLMDALVPVSIVDPTWPTPADRDEFLESLSDIQFEDIFWAAFRTNRGGASDPKERLLSSRTQTSGETSD